MMGSLRLRITVAAALLFMVTLVGASQLIIRLVERDVRAQAESTVAEALAEQAAVLGGQTLTNEVVRVGNDVGFGVFQRSGELAFGSVFFQGSEVAVVELNLTTEEVNELLDPETDEVISDPTLRSELERLTLVIRSLEGSDGELLLVGAPSPAEIDVSTAAAERALWVIIPALLVVTVTITWMLVGRALRPVDAITDRVRTISNTSLHERVPQPTGNDEIARLAATMNGMLERLERGDRRQRQFSADVSHELRSPLSTVRAAADVITRSTDGAPELAAEIVAGTDRMDRIIDDLLLLAAEDAAEGFEGEPLDFVELCRGVISNTSVEIDTPDSAVVWGQPARLRRVIANLIDNAVRHADNTVRMTVVATRTDIELAVEDDGPGIPPEQRLAVFERFVRLDEARSRDDGGAGLGLSLVQAVVQAHGGSVEVGESPRLGGARFVVRLPTRS